MYEILSGDRYACENFKSKIMNILLNTSHLNLMSQLIFQDSLEHLRSPMQLLFSEMHLQNTRITTALLVSYL